MFATLESFSIFFFSVGGLLLVGILFEDKFDAYIERRKRARKEATR